MARVKQIRSTADEPGYLFVEPSSQVVTHELQSVSAMALRDVSYEVGPLITLVDGPMFDVWWQERRELLLGQIADADVVAVSQADLLEPGEVERVRNTLNAHADGLLALSTLRGWGVEDILARIT